MEIPGATETAVPTVERVSAHSHIRGLGLDDKLNAREESQGLVGQKTARKSAGIIVKMIQAGAIAGRGILIAGPPASGKTAIAMAISRELGADIPFTSVSGSEFFSHEFNKTESLTQSMRKSIGLRIQEETELVEGEVVEWVVERPTDGTGDKVGRITLKTTDMEAEYDLGAKMIDAMEADKVTPGDVISIDKASGKVTKLGRSWSKTRDYDAQGPGTRLVETPAGELQKRKHVSHTVNLHEIDVINSRAQGFMALFSGATGEINPEVRQSVDKKVAEWREEGRATIVPGVLFIDEAHMLDIECFSFMNRAMEQSTAPIIIMATNRGENTKIRGTDTVSPHGIPADMLDRMNIIITKPYDAADIQKILQLRADAEGIDSIDEDAMDYLVTIGTETSIRYAMQLLTTAHLVARRDNMEEIQEEHFVKCRDLFLDVRRSEEFCDQWEKELITGNTVDDVEM
ncbi:RuvBL2 helicase, INO80J [Carpediemonas membranifera]|uniref:RuvB-like helicase n=1 Tax=Carpediemonas membranifera TaxID=201153 RepID=A0A8J6AUL5_9EUKA|nr:RuvBL2 helicase, INO80J [Carpediemonas membranifera]|eukprot:KAG9391980.1 RuvBL2 helicase, INO80J [Carpediemonas membranifera]